MNNWTLFRRFVGISLRSQMQYRASFLLLLFAYFVQTGVEFLGISALFARFHAIGEWQFSEIALLYGTTNIAFAIAETGSRGFDQFGNLVKSGDFDHLLLRPRSTLLQVAGQEILLMKLGRLFQGVPILLWAIVALPITWHISSLVLLTFAIFGGVCLFYALFIFQATLCFWTTETLELMNIFTFGGQEVGRYPLTIYANWFQRFFTFIIPLASVTYYPIVVVLHHPGAHFWVGWSAPLACLAFLGLSMVFWNYGVRRYCSTGT